MEMIPDNGDKNGYLHHNILAELWAAWYFLASTAQLFRHALSFFSDLGSLRHDSKNAR